MLGAPGITVNGAVFGNARSFGSADRRGRLEPTTLDVDNAIGNVLHCARISRGEQQHGSVRVRVSRRGEQCIRRRNVPTHPIRIVDERDVPRALVRAHARHLNGIAEIARLSGLSVDVARTLNGACIPREQAGGAEQQCRFAGAVRTDERNDLTVPHLERDIVQRARVRRATEHAGVIRLAESLDAKSERRIQSDSPKISTNY